MTLEPITYSPKSSGSWEHLKKKRPTWWYLWRIILFRPGLYLVFGFLEILFFAVFPHIVGLITRGFFDSLTGDATAGLGVYTFAALLIATALGRAVAIFADVIVYFNYRYTVEALLRRNMFERILERPGASAVPESPGEAVSRFRDDVHEVAFFLAEMLTVVAYGLFAVAAMVVMARTDIRITLLVFIPLVLVVFAANWAMNAVGKYREASREATGQVTGFVGEMFGAVQAIIVNMAEEKVIERFRDLNEARRQTSVKDKLFTEVLDSLFRNMVNLGTGIILFLAGQAMQDGEFSVGDLAIFVYYLGFVTDFTATIGHKIAWYRQVGVSFARMDKLLQGAPTETLVEHKPIYIRGSLPSIEFVHKTEEHRLKLLEVKGLSYHYSGTTNGINEINLSVEKGTFTVITGRIGSGKTTLLRVLLGLLPKQSGEIFWNGSPIFNPEEFFVPPRSAYTPQIPALFSESLRNNILMGLPEEELDMNTALHHAVLERDLEEFPKGLDTMVGTKGVRLSGGQRQRVATARSFIRKPELLIFDDISSALDVNTERIFWKRIYERMSLTILAVSHHRPALRQADQIIVLKEGFVDSVGSLEYLLKESAEMRGLWLGDGI